ncbi:CbtA family protein [Methylocella sp.]|uniref:CbtA family protein n=1 Tax=Methylocella sp. TaxID=1978226 RepID=UPI0037835485
MVGQLLLRGMLVGVLAGLLAFGFARVFGEPSVDRAIAFEEAVSQAKGEPPEPELVSRGEQAGVGLFTGVVVYGAALGGLFALAFAFCLGRFGALSPRATAGLLALAGFVAIALLPALKYPPNPPAIGEPETIVLRTQLYFSMIALSLVSLGAAVALARSLWTRLGAWNAALLGVALYLVLMIVAQTVLPAVNEVPDQFPAMLLWRFRLVSFGIQAILWTTLGLLFGYVAERGLAHAAAPRLARALR